MSRLTSTVTGGVSLRLYGLAIALLFIFLSPRPAPPSPDVVAAPVAEVARSPEQERTHWVVFHAQRLGVDPALALGVSRAENDTADPARWSSTGCCVGVMQVNVRVHYGEYDAACGGSDLMRTATNACYGVHILRAKLVQCEGDVRCALRRYVGASTDARARRYVARVLEAT